MICPSRSSRCNRAWLQFGLVVGVFIFASAIELRCGPPGRAVLGAFIPVQRSYAALAEVRYICEHHELISGPDRRMCLYDGTWTGDIPVCDKPAMLKSSLQSSTLNDRTAARAIDDDPATCSSSDWQAEASWTGILSGPAVVSAVKLVFPVGDVINVEVMVKEETNNLVSCGKYIGNVGSETSKLFYCPPSTKAEYVHVEDFSSTPHYFQLCNVTVFLRTESSCLIPDMPDNGFGNKRSSGHQTIYQYYCNTGYELWGDREAVCLPNGTWSPKAPTCHMITCILPASPANGSVSYEDQGGVVPWQGSANYSCNPGFSLQGPSLRYCIQWNKWSGSEPFCIAKGCGPIDSQINSGVILVNSSNVNSVALLQCEDGYRPIAEDKVYCQMNGLWSYANLGCKPIVCDPNPLVPHGTGHLLSNSTFYGSRLQVICARGYIAKNGPLSTVRMCTLSGTWGDLSNVCEEVTCEPLPSEATDQGLWLPVNDTRRPTWGAIRVLTCHPGFHVDGAPAIIQCLSNGTWSYTAAACKKTPDVALWTSDWTPSVMIIAAVAVGAGTAISILCIVSCFIVLRKRRQSKTNTTVFHVGMSDTPIYRNGIKSHPYNPEDHYYTTAMYDDLIELRSNPPVPRPRKPSSALPLLPLEADPVYAQPFETCPSTSGNSRKWPRGLVGNRDDPYTAHIYAEPVDTYRPPSGASTISGRVAEAWFRTGTARTNRKMSLPDFPPVFSDDENTKVNNDVYEKTNTYEVPPYSAVAPLCLSAKTSEHKTSDSCFQSSNDNLTSTNASSQQTTALEYNSIYLMTDDTGLQFKPVSTRMQMIDNDIYLDECHSSA